VLQHLDPLLHQQLRLAIISLLVGVRKAEFTFLREKTGATAGNLSVQISKLKEAGYISVEKKFKNNFPQTLCAITEKGLEAFENYAITLQSYLHRGESKTN
jgi:DNA-binding transcriptional ArsR family regulator